jgi:putative ABC transport system substrate-binding protein
MMKRRPLVLLAAGVCATALARAQTVGRSKRIGVLAVGGSQGSAESLTYVAALKAALRDLGWVEGESIVYDVRVAQGRSERLPDLARELLALAPDVIWTAATSAALAAKQVTTTTPIVIANAADPVGAGLAQSLARPGGNVTGLSARSTDIAPKSLELLHAALPRLARVAVLSNPGEPTDAALMQNLRSAAQALRVQLVTVPIRAPEQIEPALDKLPRDAIDAVIVPGGAMFFTHLALIGPALKRLKLPAANAGDESLLSYRQNFGEVYVRSAAQVDRILRGANPADMPIEQPTRLELVINLHTARALGITIPQSLLLRADKIIE